MRILGEGALAYSGTKLHPIRTSGLRYKFRGIGTSMKWPQNGTGIEDGGREALPAPTFVDVTDNNGVLAPIGPRSLHGWSCESRSMLRWRVTRGYATEAWRLGVNGRGRRELLEEKGDKGELSPIVSQSSTYVHCPVIYRTELSNPPSNQDTFTVPKVSGFRNIEFQHLYS